jgi:hypothetical protein
VSISSQKNIFNKKRRKLKINSAAPSGGEEKLTYFMYFPSPPLEAGLSISTFCFFLVTCTRKHLFIYPLIYERNYPATSISKYNFNVY